MFKSISEIESLKSLCFFFQHKLIEEINEIANEALGKKNINLAFHEYLKIRDSLSMALSEVIKKN
jgi:hypothetical protein